MAKPEKAPKKEKVAPKGRTNMVSSRKDFDKVYDHFLTNEPDAAPTVAKAFGMLSQEMSKLGWSPKVKETEEPTPTPVDPTAPSPVDNAPTEPTETSEAGTNTED